MTQEELDRDYLDGPGAAKVLGVSDSHVRRLCLSGKLDGVLKVGTSGWLIPRASVRAYKPGKRGRKSNRETDAALLSSVLTEAKGQELDTGERG